MDYYNEIEKFIKRNEVNKRTRIIEENNDALTTYWNIGRLLVEAQGGDSRAKYGNKLIKEWSKKYTEKYGNGYSETNLKLYRKFFLIFQNSHAVRNLLWTHIRKLLSIKDENKRNYYINLCTEKNLSSRELINEIKNNSYERLINKPEKIEIKSNQKQIPLENMKNPIVLELTKDEQINSEFDLEMIILSKLKSFFSQLGNGFSLIQNQYKLTIESKNYYIDLLLFNYKLNCFVVVELKLRELRKEDKAQIEYYMGVIDKQVKEVFHNKTIGIIISKEQDKLIANFVGSESIIPLTYKIERKD